MRPWEKVDQLKEQHPNWTMKECFAKAGISGPWYYKSKRNDMEGKPPARQRSRKLKPFVKETETETKETGVSAVQPLRYEEAVAVYDTVQLKATELDIAVDEACQSLGFDMDTYGKCAEMVQKRQDEDRRKREEEADGAKGKYFERAVENGVKKALGVARKEPTTSSTVPTGEVTAIILRGSVDAIATLLERLV